MAQVNLSSETAKQSETLAQLRCVAGWADGIHKPIITLSIINIFLSITAFLGNFLILVALHKESSLHSPSKFLYRCLATTDLCVGLISEPSAVMYWLSLVNEYWNFCLFMQITHFVAGFILASVSLLTMTAVSVDRLLALILGLRYKQVVTLKRTHLLLIIFWIVSSMRSRMSRWNTQANNNSLNINIFLSITAFLSNSLILVALHKESSLHSPFKLMYRCLATTDLCVGLFSEP